MQVTVGQQKRKGEPSLLNYAARPAPLVRGSSRRITTMRFQPANISVINRRASRLTGTCRASRRQTEKI